MLVCGFHKVSLYGVKSYLGDFIFKCDELASALLRIENSPSFLPSPLTQNLDKNQNLAKQINPFHIQIT
jgi:hypothetical protein